MSSRQVAKIKHGNDDYERGFENLPSKGISTKPVGSIELRSGPDRGPPLGTAAMKVSLNSSLIDSIAYDRTTHHLRIFLSNGQRRDYGQVPTEVIDRLIAARSPGQFYSTEIRGRYPVDQS